MALSQAYDRQGWYASTRELQLASLPFCVACRNVATLRLRIDDYTPPHLLAPACAADTAPAASEDRGTVRIPRLRALAVTWERNSSAELDSPLYALAEADVFTFFESFDCSVASVAWPRRLRVIDFGDDFDQPISSVAWPPTIEALAFGLWFNQAVDEISLPSSLLDLSFDDVFNRPIVDLSWPPSLQRVRFGQAFNQPIERVVWPSSLRQIYLDGCFNRPINSVAWPTSLQRLRFGENFNMPVDLVNWPPSLKDVVFGIQYWVQNSDSCGFSSKFDQALDSTLWPASLRRVTLGGAFAQSLHALGTWMPFLEEFTLFVEDYSILAGIRWPKGLKKLTIYGDMDLNGVVIPPTVQVNVHPEFNF